MKTSKLMILAVAATLTLTACQKKIVTPSTVDLEDLQALLMEDPVNSEKVAVYADVWQKDLAKAVEKYESQNDEMAKSELKALVEHAKEVQTKLKSLSSLTTGDLRTNLNSSALKVNSTLESAERFLSTSAAPAAPAQPPVTTEPGAYHLSFSDDTYFFQGGSYPTLAEAKAYYYDYIMKVYIPGKGVFYRSLKGPYASKFDTYAENGDADMDAKGFAVSWHTLKKNYVCFIR